jgi:uncharacterized protein YndB with AHSA1/START domain
MKQSSKNSRDIKASAEKIYKALTDPSDLVKWQVPGQMTAKIHSFDLKVGGGYEMSLFYPQDDHVSRGKTKVNEDRFSARFVELIPNKRIVEAIKFNSPDPDFAGEMTLEINLQAIEAGTRVTFLFKNIPPGIRPEDNEAGTASSLEKLAGLVED